MHPTKSITDGLYLKFKGLYMNNLKIAAKTPLQDNSISNDTVSQPPTYIENMLERARAFNQAINEIIQDTLGFINSIVLAEPETIIPLQEPTSIIEPIATAQQEPAQETIETLTPNNALICQVGRSLKERFWNNATYMLFVGDRVEATEILCKVHNEQFFIKPNGCTKDKVKLFVPRKLFHLLKGAANVKFASVAA